MKIIDIPKDAIKVKIGEVLGGDGRVQELHKEISFKDFLVRHIDATQAPTVSHLTKMQKVVTAIESGNGSIALEDAEYELVSEALKKPVWSGEAGRALLPFYAASEKVQDVKK